MIVEQEFGLVSSFLLNAEVFINNADSGFAIHGVASTGDVEGTVSGYSTGFSLSGVNGAIFNDSGKLIAGFRQKQPFSIELHQDSNGTSVLKDGVVMQSMTGIPFAVNALLVEKEEASSIQGGLNSDESLCVFGDSSGISALYFDNELFLCV